MSFCEGNGRPLVVSFDSIHHLNNHTINDESVTSIWNNQHRDRHSVGIGVSQVVIGDSFVEINQSNESSQTTKDHEQVVVVVSHIRSLIPFRL